MSAEPDLLVVGGGLGGVAAALAATALGLTVLLAEPGDWLGGQLTTQAVPPDEHPWIEGPHVSARYAALRRAIREHYLAHAPLTDAARADPLLNPGGGYVSALCCEPRVAAAVIDRMLAPAVHRGVLILLRRCRAVAAQADGDRITAVLLRDEDGRERTVSAPYVIDATEDGGLLELAGVEHVVGAESARETGELHAPDVADPLDQQAITWCFALSHHAGEDHTIDRPAGYARFRDARYPFWPGSQLSWTDVTPATGEPRRRPLFSTAPGEPGDRDRPDWWHYRRIVSAAHHRAGTGVSDVTLVNWPQNDYWLAPVIGVDADAQRRALLEAKELSRSLLYWMQTEAPRHDGGTGYPGLRLRGDVLGTEDGFAMEPYLRESRRIRARFTVTERHIGRRMRGEAGSAEQFSDSVGIGWYRIDLHPSTAARGYVDIDCHPFQIPLGALLPERVENLLPAAKNLGTTHLSNGAYRLHPVEWSIGEASGALIAFCARTGRTPHAVREGPTALADFQRLLTDSLGVPLQWPEEIRTAGPVW